MVGGGIGDDNNERQIEYNYSQTTVVIKHKPVDQELGDRWSYSGVEEEVEEIEPDQEKKCIDVQSRLQQVSLYTTHGKRAAEMS